MTEGRLRRREEKGERRKERGERRESSGGYVGWLRATSFVGGGAEWGSFVWNRGGVGTKSGFWGSFLLLRNPACGRATLESGFRRMMNQAREDLLLLDRFSPR